MMQACTDLIYIWEPPPKTTTIMKNTIPQGEVAHFYEQMDSWNIYM
jgi:hypothetical protein